MPVKGVASALKYLSLSLALDLVLGPSGGGGRDLGRGALSRPMPPAPERGHAAERSGGRTRRRQGQGYDL